LAGVIERNGNISEPTIQVILSSEDRIRCKVLTVLTQKQSRQAGRDSQHFSQGTVLLFFQI
jgi:hypothetical protein